VIVIGNFTPVPRHNFRIGVPKAGWYREIFNSDSTYYGGSNVGNGPGLMTQDMTSHGRPCSLLLTLPPLAAIVLKPE